MNTRLGKPSNLDEYADWMAGVFDLEVQLLEDQYTRVVTTIKRQFVEGSYWRRVRALLPELASAYYVRSGFQLAHPSAPEVLDKSWESFWLKTFRRNVTENPRWPRPPVGGWLVPNRWYTQIGDAVRSRVVVRYLDGVELTAGELVLAARGTGVKTKSTFQATRQGYYAAHVSVTGRFVVPRITFDTESIRARVEIQVTTQVKDVIQELLHKYYEESRRSLDVRPEPSGWDYLSSEFRSTYIGHLAHHMEGVIMELRQEDES